MWTVNANHIFSLRTPGGDRFTEFVDALIRAEAYTEGFSQSEVSSNLRTNIGDKGVDTEVRQPTPANRRGWMGVPTCWQYKATDYSNISNPQLRQEINKPYAQRLIQQGYGYRFCICDDLPPNKIRQWEDILDAEVKKLNPSAPRSRVVTASALADWASQYPAIIVRFFKPELTQCLAIEEWGKIITQQTAKYVEVVTWAAIQQNILDHINFNISCNNVILQIQGEAGVGKTRLVYETLANVTGAQNLVLYAIDDKALLIADFFLKDERANIILVADECLPQTKYRLETLLKSQKQRARVICIDNSGERIEDFEQLWLERIPERDVESILEKNFPTVPLDRRRIYVNLSRGFVRLAADLCSQDNEIAAKGNIGFILSDVRNYLRNRINNEELEILEAISLFRKVGYRDDVKEELDLLCEILQLEKRTVIYVSQKLKDAPGFIAFAGRYLYITPEIIAQVSFAGAWKRWAKYNPEEFLGRIPNELLDAFLNRVSKSGSEEVRRIVGKFFQNWAAGLQPMDLSDVSTVDKFVVLVEINPDEYLPRLARLIDRASQDELLKISRDYRGTRRSLVWLAEKMSAFPEFFPDGESILWKLALTETEFHLANNATHTWEHLFQIFLSGTAVPFVERMDLLEQRLLTKDEEKVKLALKCLSRAFDTQGERVLGAPVVAGRIPPSDWKPQTELEFQQCLDKALNVLSKAISSDNPSLCTGALNVVVERLPTLLAYGYLEQVKSLFPIESISQDVLVSLIRKLEDILHIHSDTPKEVREWLQSLIPNDFHGRLIQTVGKSPWGYSFEGSQEAWQNEINSIAHVLCEQPELLKAEIMWLCSPQAMSVWDLGYAMGAYDANAVCLDVIMGGVEETQATGLAREYIGSLLRNHPQHTAVVNEWIDKVEIQSPAIAYDLFRAGGDVTKAVERTLKLVDTGVLSLEYLGGFSFGVLGRQLHKTEFYEILSRLVSSVKEGENTPITQTAIKLIAYRLESEKSENIETVLDDSAIASLIWELLEITALTNSGDAYRWNEILRSLAKTDVDKVARIASLALVGENNQQKDYAEQILVDFAKSYPDVVMQRIGEVILSEEYRWHFFTEKYRFLIQNLPIDAMKNWLDAVGHIGAQRIARNLAVPHLDENGNPVIPPLTEFILSEFEEDDTIFQKFCTGSHSLQMYMGDIASQKRQEAEIARKFLNHPLRRIREWAEYEIVSCEQDAKMWHRIDEESMI
ncbi:MAG: hypothetical protein SAK29_04810 [Scytonema sp. PMC 1069.18]|nr:hypothetical protein [Scytonema sp. PMC 1069.18]MEC4884303.1 hypothetical protein [Scytonema sp. PMC 1070.18]